MDSTTKGSSDQPAWQGEKAPCVYCGQVIGRSEERCPHCKTSFSPAVRRASREVMGDWFYLDSRNPSGRGITFETLIKMIEKGRIKADSIVRGPTTHQDWLYAAETPRLAKYLGMCPHCFAEAKPEDTYCTRCQLNMNTRAGEPRPGVPADLAREPFHRAAHEMEQQLAQPAEPAAPAPPSFAPKPEPAAAAGPAEASKPVATVRGEAVAAATAAAAAAVAEAPGAAAERRSRVAATRRRKPRVWLVLILTWMTLILIAVVIWLVFPQTYNRLTGAFGLGPGTDSKNGGTKSSDEWLNQQLADAAAAAQAKDFARAVEIYDAIIAKTGDVTTWQPRKQTLLQQKAQEERKERLAKLKERLELAESMAAEQKVEDALAILRSIGQDDRTWLDSLGVSVEKMERTLREDQLKAARLKQQEEKLVADLARAAAAKNAGNLPDALKLYKQIAGTYPAETVQKHLNVDQVTKELEAQIAAAKPPTPPTMTPEQAATAVADLMGQAAALEKDTKFKEALEVLESIKQKFEQKYWPDTLEARIRQVKGKKEAWEFFGMEGPKKPPA
ncbi:MAG: hypothetical protein IMZ44_12670 [Planctomycetes bacterium]|nr:hypothetical protein [Planctomycetota bacterium]